MTKPNFPQRERAPANDNHFVLAVDTNAARKAIRHRFWDVYSELTSEGYDDALVFEEAFSVLTDDMYRSAHQQEQERYWSAFERYNQAARFAGKLKLLECLMFDHYMNNLDNIH